MYLSGSEAASLLGIKRETLYAYASRGLVRSEPGERGRARRYRRDDLERLKARHDARAGHGAVAAGALRWGEPVLSSALTAIDPRVGPIYRGLSAVSLAGKASFEATAELLWAIEPPDPATFPRRVPAFRAAKLAVRPRRLAALIPAGSPPLSALFLGVPALGAVDPHRFDRAPDGDRKRARILIARMAALVGVPFDPDRAAASLAAGSVARTFLAALGARVTDEAEAAIDRALVVCADHELNASTFAVRITASTRADLYACVSAGLATISGPRHGGVCDRVEALIADVGRPEAARAFIQDRIRHGKAVPGFGHLLYPGGDPRAILLLEIARGLGEQGPAVRTSFALIEAMRAAKREAPTLDMGLVAITAALGLPTGAATALFALGRTAGWIAHTFEQRALGFLLRPRARYIGPPVAEVP